MQENKVITVTLPVSRESVSVFLRTSLRAKRCVLRVTDRGGELVLPPFLPEREAVSFLESSLLWLEKTLKKRFSGSVDPAKRKYQSEYPSELVFASQNRSYPVFYTFLDVPWVGVKIREEKEIHVTGNILSPSLVREAFEGFILRSAEKFLPDLLRKTAEATGLKYEKCSVRLQSSRWGSCSSRGAVSLNAMLLFVPQECVRYVLIHELCHTLYMDHSGRFWKEVAKYEPNWKYLRALLKRTQIPGFPGK